MPKDKCTENTLINLFSKSLKGPKIIDTPNLYIEGNIMSWEDNMLQLSNVVNISTVPQGLLAFPFWTLLLILAGFILIRQIFWFALIMLILSGIIIYWWYKRNEELKTQSHLVIHTNSGKVYSFLFSDRKFLKEVFNVLGEIILNGHSMKGGIHISITGNKIEQGASILNNLKNL